MDCKGAIMTKHHYNKQTGEFIDSTDDALVDIKGSINDQRRD